MLSDELTTHLLSWFGLSWKIGLKVKTNHHTLARGFHVI